MRDLLIYGFNAVTEALESGAQIESVMVSTSVKDKTRHELERLAAKHKVAMRKVPRKELDRLTNNAVHQGVVATWGIPKPLDLDEVIAAQVPGCKLLVCLDEVQDPRNLGALARSALAFGALGLVLPGRRSAGLTAASVKASAGALCRLPVSRVGNLGQTLDYLKKQGFWVTGAELGATQAPWDIDPGDKMVLVLGSEGSGLRPSIAARLDFAVTIPMVGQSESLNVSVAGALLMYEWLVRSKSAQT